MIEQSEFEGIRPLQIDNNCDDSTLERYHRTFDLEYLGGRYDTYEAHGITLGFGSKNRSRLAWLEISGQGSPSIRGKFLAGLSLPFSLGDSHAKIASAFKELHWTDGEQICGHGDYGWAYFQFTANADAELVGFEMFNLTVCESNVYKSELDLPVRDVLMARFSSKIEDSIALVRRVAINR